MNRPIPLPNRSSSQLQNQYTIITLKSLFCRIWRSIEKYIYNMKSIQLILTISIGDHTLRAIIKWRYIIFPLGKKIHINLKARRKDKQYCV